MRVNYIEILINVILASFGGLVKKLSDIENKPERKMSLSNYIIGALGSMFVGIVVYFLCKSFNTSQFLTACLTALSGYVGTPVLDLLSDAVKKYFKKQSKL